MAQKAIHFMGDKVKNFSSDVLKIYTYLLTRLQITEARFIGDPLVKQSLR